MLPLHCSSYVAGLVVATMATSQNMRVKTSLHYYFIGISLEAGEAFF